MQRMRRRVAPSLLGPNTCPPAAGQLIRPRPALAVAWVGTGSFVFLSAPRHICWCLLHRQGKEMQVCLLAAEGTSWWTRH